MVRKRTNGKRLRDKLPDREIVLAVTLAVCVVRVSILISLILPLVVLW